MSTIHLQNVTQIYSRTSHLAYLARGKGLIGQQADGAFAERVSAQVETQFASRAVQSGDILALDHVTLTIPDGQTFAVIGPSGCGKSTLLRVVAGLEPGYRGEILYDDQDMRDVSPGDRYIGMVFQNYALYPHFAGRGNLRFFFRVHQAPDAEAEERIRVTSEIMGIGFRDLLKRKPGTLSGGQQQRVAIARALVRNPRLFLFDEPLSNLDAKLRVQTRVEIKRLLRRFQLTAIYVTHDQTEAITLGDQIAVMRQGRIEQVGSYRELMDNPQNAFVAGFLGRPPMNLLPGLVREGAIHLGGVILPLPAPMKNRLPHGQPVTIGIRPDKAALCTADLAPEPSACLPAAIEMIEPDFDRHTMTLYLRTAEMTYAVIHPLDHALQVGNKVRVHLPPAHLYFFDQENGKRLS